MTIAGTPMTILGSSPNAIAGLTPPGPPGPATVVVRSPTGCQATLTYTYQ